MEVHSPTEHEAQGQALSVDRLAHEYHGAFIRFLRRRLRGTAEPADVAQEAYIRMLQYEGSRHLRSPYSMLLRIALNVAQDMNRSNRVRRVLQHRHLDEMEIASGAPTPEKALSIAEDLDRALAAIERLPPRCRQVFLLHRRQHLSYSEIAVECGISVKMVEKHISSALAFCVAEVWGDELE